MRAWTRATCTTTSARHWPRCVCWACAWSSREPEPAHEAAAAWPGPPVGLIATSGERGRREAAVGLSRPGHRGRAGGRGRDPVRRRPPGRRRVPREGGGAAYGAPSPRPAGVCVGGRPGSRDGCGSVDRQPYPAHRHRRRLTGVKQSSAAGAGGRASCAVSARDCVPAPRRRRAVCPLGCSFRRRRRSAGADGRMRWYPGKGVVGVAFAVGVEEDGGGGVREVLRCPRGRTGGGARCGKVDAFAAGGVVQEADGFVSLGGGVGVAELAGCRRC